MPEIVSHQNCTVGEGPLWHPDEGRLYWVDNIGRALYRYDPETDETKQLVESDLVAAFTIQADGSLLLFMDEGRVEWWDHGDRRTVVDGIDQEDGMRFNDVIADPEGRVFAGTMDDDDQSAGRLYRLDTDGSITEVFERVELSNGLGFTPDRDALYLTETNTNRIYEFEYDRSTGELGNRTIFSERSDPGMYDGLTVDAEGTVWSALWDHGALVAHEPDGTVRRAVELPTHNITSLTFGGPDYKDVYVTSAAWGSDEEDEAAGALFRLDLGVPGVPEFRSDVEL